MDLFTLVVLLLDWKPSIVCLSGYLVNSWVLPVCSISNYGNDHIARSCPFSSSSASLQLQHVCLDCTVPSVDFVFLLVIQGDLFKNSEVHVSLSVLLPELVGNISIPQLAGWAKFGSRLNPRVVWVWSHKVMPVAEGAPILFRGVLLTRSSDFLLADMACVFESRVLLLVWCISRLFSNCKKVLPLKFLFWSTQ